MTPLTAAELMEFIAECSGDAELADGDPSLLERSFQELAIDSLALLETATLIQRRIGVQLPEDLISELPDPRTLLDEVNRRIITASSAMGDS